MLNQFDINSVKGLTQKEADERLKKEGYNELQSASHRSIFRIIFEIVREPMFLLLIACGAIYLILGDVKEALMLLGFVFVVIGITVYQERKTERTLEALRDLSSPRALVIRDGERKIIPGREVVRGDILSLAEGDRVPADAIVLWCSHMSIDESLLTGESVPVRKTHCEDNNNVKMGFPGGDDFPYVYAGTLVVKGLGIAEVQTIGMHTEIGKIGKALETVKIEKTLIQQSTEKLVEKLAILGLMVCALLIVVYGITRGDWLHGFLAGITLAMAMLPEEFPVVLTIFLALGAWRISQNQVLTRRVSAIETLGAATVLCVDKTGTLTLNRMSVRKIFSIDGEFYEFIENQTNTLPEIFHNLVEFSVLASQKDPFDPMEKAIQEISKNTISNTEHLHDDWMLVQEYPLSQNLLALSLVWQSPDKQNYFIASKGAPEAILDLCHFDENKIKEISKHINAMANEGLRVIGVARSYFQKTDLPEEQHDIKFEFLGLIGLADPIRPSVPAAVKECYTAGMRIIMITGDHPGIAQNIANKIDLYPRDEVITGLELNSMEDEMLEERIKRVNIFARVVPEQKLRIVNALKSNGEIVAMTGDGVNDAPALKSAHIGIAMGARGTDVAREASALVLLDDDFSSIVSAVRMGRRIFDNLKKAIAYIFAVHVPIVGISLIPVLFKLPLVLLPVHIVFLELIIDPACSVIFEAEKEEKNIMNCPPRKSSESLFDKKTVGLSLLQGISVLFIILVVFGISLYRGQGEQEARVLSFTTLVIANLGLILTNRSWSRTILGNIREPNSALVWVVSGTLIFLSMVLYIPFLRNVFHLAVMHTIDLTICVTAGIASIMWFEGLKAIKGYKN